MGLLQFKKFRTRDIFSQRRKFLLRDSLLCTLLTVVVSGVFYLLFLNISFLDPFSKAFKDFSFTDIYYSELNEEETFNKDIIIVNIKQSDRYTIAQAIEKSEQQQPKVIGLDMIFKDRKDSFFDSILRQTLLNYKNIVSAYVIDMDTIIKNHDYFVGNHAKEGFINVSLAGQDAVIRDFIGVKDDKHYSFSTQIALASKLMNEKDLSKLDEKIPINYIGNQDAFLTFDIDELLELDSIPAMKNAIVLFGYLGTPTGNPFDIEDKLFTPLNKKFVGKSTPDMFGVAIHANIINMLISDNFIKKIPKPILYLLAIVSSFFTILLGMVLYKRSELAYDTLIKIIQFVISIVLFYLALVLLKQNIYLYVTPIMVLTLFGLEMIDFYAYILDYLKKRFKWKSYLLD